MRAHPRRDRLQAGFACALILLLAVTIQPAVAQVPQLPSPPQIPELPELPEVPGVAGPGTPSTNETVSEVRDAVSDAVGGGGGEGETATPPETETPPAAGAPEIGGPPAGAESPAADQGEDQSSPGSRGDAPTRAADPVRGGDRQFLAGRTRPRAEGPLQAPEPGGDATLAARIGDAIATLPTGILIGLLAMAALALLMTGRSAWFVRSTGRLRRQRSALREDIGVLQSAIIPDVPAEIAGAAVAIAYRPAAGPAAGGDFHDVFELGDDRFGIVFGDVSGHGPGALPSTAIIRYTIRAYLEAGLEPRAALRLADRALAGSIGGDFATAIASVFDARTGLLTYAGAGHPAPLFSGGHEHRPIAAMSAPPIGLGPAAGSRQTTASVGPDGTVWLFTDGLIEVRVSDGELFGRDGLEAMLADGPEPTELLERIAGSARAVPDDMTACSIRPAAAGGTVVAIEEVEVAAGTDVEALREFATACGLRRAEISRIATRVGSIPGAGTATLRISRRGSEIDWELAADRPTPGTAPKFPPNQILGEAMRIPG